MDKELWKMHLSKPRHNRLCATCHKPIGIDGGECRFNCDHDSDGQYDYACDDCRAARLVEEDADDLATRFMDNLSRRL